MEAQDRDAALALSTAEGWNQCAADWSRLIHLEPSGCFAAREGDRLVGTVTTTTYGRALAWIGMMVVDPEFRRQGIGVGLMKAALDFLRDAGIESVKLDATPAGKPLYESLGFRAEAELERWQGIARGPARNDAEPTNGASEQALIALDRTTYGVDRSRMLAALVADGVGEPLAVLEDGRPLGLALARRGRVAAYIGPLIAATASDAVQLLDSMLFRLAGQEVCLDHHRGGLLEAKALAERGLSKRRGLVRMALGRPSSAGTARTICGSTGPEYG